MVSHGWLTPIFAVLIAALAAGVSPVLAERSTLPLVQQLQSLADQHSIRLRIVGHLEGEGGDITEAADVEVAIKRLIPKEYSFVLGFGPDHSVSSLTVYGDSHTGAVSGEEAIDRIVVESPASDLALSVERQQGLASDEVAWNLADTLADRTAPEVRAKLAAIKLLAEMPLESARQSLEQGLGARQPEVRLAAIKAIERAGGKDAVFLMAQAYHVETDPDILGHLLERFSQMDHPLAAAMIRSQTP